MRILILSFYFPPDLSAGSFRARALVEALEAEAGSSLSLDIITTAPNRYQSHQVIAPEFEELGSVRIHRIALPAHQSGMRDQAKAFSVYARRVNVLTRARRWDLVVATSSRLMTAALGASVARRSRSYLYLDIRDLFTDTMNDLLAESTLRLLLPVFDRLERWTLRRADRVNVVSAGFLPHVHKVLPEQPVRTFTNGIDEEFMDIDFAKREQDRSQLPLIVYAGNIGDGQGLHRVIPGAAKRLEGKAKLRIIGDGGRRAQLERNLLEPATSNVALLPPVSRIKLFDHYRDADILLLHLNDHPAFHKVLPSKIFEYAATGKPILAGVAGYAADFLRSEVPGVEVFAPCDAAAMSDAAERLFRIRQVVDREAFCERYARKSIMREFAKDILALGKQV
ncbi:MAG: glycosyltransferase family 4 protein [Gammaproteobacteria bacterium]|nr:glycosyltransferase family 4 protein [Gammaproteobacteria bacterium]